MKQISTYIILAIIAIASFTACNKAISDEFVAYPNNSFNDTVWSNNGYNAYALNKIIIPEAANNTIVDSFNYLVDNTLAYGDSLQISFPANACINANGLPITSIGKVKIEISLLKKRGDFIKNGIPTTNVFSLLEAGNYCDIKLTKDGQDVMLNPNNQVKIRIKDSTASTNMKFFVGNTINNNRDSLFSWAPSQNGQVSIWKDNSGSSASKILGYELNTNRIRWFGTAYFADSSSAKTRVNVTLPLNYTNKNTVVFAVFKAKKTIANFSSDAATKLFFTINIPVNTDLTLMSITRINNDFYLGSKSLKVTNADPINVLPEKKTLAQILEFLEKL